MTSAWDTAVQKLESKSLQRMLGRPTLKQVNKIRGAMAEVYAEAKTSHESFPLGSIFGFSAAILKKDTYKLETTWSLVHRSDRTLTTTRSSKCTQMFPDARRKRNVLS